MVTQAKKPALTVEAFDTLAAESDDILEFIDGEIFTVPSNAFVSYIAGVIFGELYMWLKGKNIGWLTGEAGGYQVAGERYAPDVAFISKAKQPQLARQGYNPNPPDLAVEVISDPGNAEELDALRKKITNYHAVGVIVWVVKYDERVVEIHQPGTKLVTLGDDDMLDGGDLLPGFTLAIKDIFPPEEDERPEADSAN